MPLGPWFLGSKHWPAAPAYYAIAQIDGYSRWFWAIWFFPILRNDPDRYGIGSSFEDAEESVLVVVPGAKMIPDSSIDAAMWHGKKLSKYVVRAEFLSKARQSK